MKRALITGITGQDGSYLAELLLEKGYSVHGLMRRSSSFNTGRINHIFDDLNLHFGDMTDPNSLIRVLNLVQPDEVYNLAAQSHVRVSFDEPVYTGDADAMGFLHLMESLHALRMTGTKVYQASSSEMFGKVVETPQNENTPFYPRSPYGVSKLFAHWTAVNYRESYGMFCSSGILFNHESPRRGETFVTRKITKAAARIKLGLQKELVLGNLNSKRDWGYAQEYVEAMWLMLQQPIPEDFVIATGETYTVREFVQEAFEYLDLDWEKYVRQGDRYLRPAEVDLLQGDASKAKKVLNWEPKTKFAALVKLMVDSDLSKETHDSR